MKANALNVVKKYRLYRKKLTLQLPPKEVEEEDGEAVNPISSLQQNVLGDGKKLSGLRHRY